MGCKASIFCGLHHPGQADVTFIPSFYMQVAKIPMSMCMEIERIVRGFIWGAKNDMKKSALVNGNQCCQPIENGGLGFRKLVFSLLTNMEALLVRIMRSKYKMIDACPISINHASYSYIWRFIVGVWDEIRRNVYWFIGNGRSTSFREDVWVPALRPLTAHYVSPDLIERHLRVRDLVD